MNYFGNMTGLELATAIPQKIIALVSSHFQTVPAAINYVLAAMAVCNVFLLISGFAGFFMPNMGFNTFLVTMLSCAQNAAFFASFNGQKFIGVLTVSARHGWLNPSSFHVGAMFGATVGMALADLTVSVYFGQLSRCQEVQAEIPQYTCNFKGSMRSIWFFGGLLFWLNVILATLIALGKDELSSRYSQYEDIGVSMNEFDSEVAVQQVRRGWSRQTDRVAQETV